MRNYIFHTPDSAPAAARETLVDAHKELGFIPNLYAGLANAPPVLDAYIALANCFRKTTLTPIEQQVVSLAAGTSNDSGFRAAGHTTLARSVVRVPETEIEALIRGKAPGDMKLGVLSAFTRAVVNARGRILADPAFRAFLEAGYSREQALEVILGVTEQILSAYADHLLQTSKSPQLEQP